MTLLALLSDHWRHDLQPVLFRIPFPKIGALTDGIPIRYYSLAYLFGLAFAWWFMKRLAKGRRIALDENMVADLVIPYALLGVMIGGRLGYEFFYDVDPIDHRWVWLHDPMKFFRIWEGGMASHGGILGVLVAFWLFARSRKVPLSHLLDLACLTAPMGLFLGRIANFINGELWGRSADVPWAMVFPGGGPLPRHPSQLYEAALEGLVLCIALWLLMRAGALKRPGLVIGAFAVGYSIARIICEFFREPDPQLGFLWGGMTMGMLLSVPLMLTGFAFMAAALKRPLLRA